MSILDYIFRNQAKKSATLAKERLKIIVSHERNHSRGPDYLPILQKELLQVITKYTKINQDQVNIELKHSDRCSTLELNITLPNSES